MNILLINHYAGSPELGMEFRPYYLACEWNKSGHNTTIVGSNYSHLRNKNPQNIGEEPIDGVRYFWLWSNKYKSNGLLRFFSMLIFVLQLFLLTPYIWYKFKPHIIISSSTYPLDIFPAWLMAKLSRARLVFEIHDLWPLSPMLLGNMSKYHPFIALMRCAEWFAYKYSDKIISILPQTYEHVARDGVAQEKWAYIPNGIKMNLQEDILPKSLELYISQKKKEGYFLVGYAGSIGIANALDTLILAANQLEKERIVFIIIGNGPEKESLTKLTKSKNVIFHDRISKKQVATFFKKMDLLCLTWQKNPLYSYGVSPNKIFDYMYARKPILQAIDAGNDLVKEAQCGLTVQAENPQAISAAILKFSKLAKSKLDKIGENGYDYVTKNHNYKKLAQDFLRHCCGK
jgi:glycosyltransferase involved in cell wall biosynthesis